MQRRPDLPPMTVAFSSSRLCRRCLLRDQGETDLYRTITEYLESLDPLQRTDSRTYEQRLERCQKCPYLQNGMCRLCGCFAEVRAAKTASYCPDTPPRWGAGD